MRVCVTATSDGLDAQVDPRFGRCQYFVIVDSETMEFEAVRNESADAPGGAGIQAAQTVVSLGVEAVITGNVGPNAFQTLSAAGIRVFTGAHGTVKDAVEMFKRGELREAGGATVAPHFGMSFGASPPSMPQSATIKTPSAQPPTPPQTWMPPLTSPVPPAFGPGFGGGGKGWRRGGWRATAMASGEPPQTDMQELRERIERLEKELKEVKDMIRRLKS
ncbi:MAG: putative Fe-Mo cluster-binding protein [Candidatus Alkanophagales archaeon MCA70_species_1]|nr:putative Fe-Mo cluster-binding protein [Candidatus Alkanophaga volatiphilum]